MKPNYQSSKLYQADLYDRIKGGGNHIVCLAQDGTKTFILLASIRHLADQLHPNNGSKITIVIEPNETLANERQRILNDHTELLVTNTFGHDKLDCSTGQVVITSVESLLGQNIPSERVNLIIFDHAHIILTEYAESVEDIVRFFHGTQLLAFMCSLIHNNNELTPSKIIELIRRLETLFKAKCETSSDLKSLSRQTPVKNMDVMEFHPSEMITCDWYLLTDFILKQFCDSISDTSLDDNKPMIEVETDLSHVSGVAPALSLKKQLALVRSCMSDVLYSMHCLGLWCTKKTTKMYLTEFSRLVQGETPVGDLISAATSILNCVYGRLDALVPLHDTENLFIDTATPQLKCLLESIKESRPQVVATWPFCIVHVRRRVIAKVIALWLQKVASSYDDYSFIKPNYIVGSARKHRNRMAVDNFDLHHEASIRDFRFGNCNVLVTSALSERCTDLPRCHLVISFDFPARFSDFIQAKGNCRFESSKYIVMINSLLEAKALNRLSNYVDMERLLNNVNKRIVLESEESTLLEKLEPQFGLYPSKDSKNPASIWRAASIINKYCSKLPSDSFTKLSPEWNIKEILEDDGKWQYYCEIRLPINSPVRQTIVGPTGPTKNIAARLAAFFACKVLHKAGELDDNMMPITKESMRVNNPLNKSEDSSRRRGKGSSKNQSVGSTKHRQYYKKRIAKVFSGPSVTAGERCNLYKFSMVLNCPIPDEQNRRGRRIIDPSETNRNYAIVCSTTLPNVCSFPLFTRSGEVFISVELIRENMVLSQRQVEDLRVFHEFTFSKVLKLEQYPIIYDPDRSQFTVLLAPVIDLALRTEIDWDFVEKITLSNNDSHVPDALERQSFKFNHQDYVDAVVIPWYRLTDRQQFAYYVAEICADLSPESPFPDEESGYKTFMDYYRSKYKIEIYNTDQPVLDVDHTSARLNLLTPRYVNRKGRTLPSSTAKTRRESRENLVQKQLLIPELCSIHPFPASFWRKAVCLPCIFYRLNSLFLAEELRRQVSHETRVGFVEPPKDFKWPHLNFGWSLKDVITSQTAGDDEADEKEDEKDKHKKKLSKDRSSASLKTDPKATKKAKIAEAIPPVQSATSDDTAQNDQDFVIDHFDPSKYNIPDIPLDSPVQDWANIKLISSGQVDSDQPMTGWDQPIEQRDLFIEHTNEITWSDCEMEYEGDISEKVSQMRCGSPSAFEIGFSFSQEPAPRPAHVDLPAASVKSVQFDEYPEKCVDSAKPANVNSFECSSDSVSSWTLSDDDFADGANSDDEVRSFGEWKDSKSKSQTLLRELFVPISRLIGDCSPNVDIDLLYRTIGTHLCQDEVSGGDLIIADVAKEIRDDNGSPKKLQVKNVPSSDTQKMKDILRKIFGSKLAICDEDVEAALNASCSTIRKLDSLVEDTLNGEPDMYRDNGIELVAVVDTLNDCNLEAHPTFGELLPNRDTDCDWPNEEWKNIKFDPTMREIRSDGPGPSVILQALTMSNASDGINLERLETVGDSFLKYSITAYLYCTCPTLHEGKLSFLRSQEISNLNLYELGRSKNLGELMSATKFEPNDNWLAPGYTVAEIAPVEDKDDNKKREIDRALAEVPYDLLLQHSIPDKSIADCVEALIGAYLTASGSRAALLFMKWLGLRVMPDSFDIESDFAKKGEDLDATWHWLGTPPSPLIVTPPSYDRDNTSILQETLGEGEMRQKAILELHRHYCSNNLDKFERDIQYTFRDKAYLVQAFTHNSFYDNHVTDCHQRLEFLGDALLDYLITRYLFEDPRCHSPGTLTDLRSALVNNTFFASLAVKYKFHKYLRYISDELFNVIDGFVKKFRFGTKDTITKGHTLLISEGESEYAEDIEVPKALGDVFESVAGAIYLDSGLSLDQVWQVYFKMMKPEIEYFSQNVPKSPIRELLESMPQKVRFSPSELAPDRKHRVIAEVFTLGRFMGVGRNKHSAKSTAAKRALRMLARKRKEESEAQKSIEDGAD